MIAARWALGLLVHRRGRTTAVGATVALTVAFVGALGAFLAHARSDLTRRAAAAVPVDWQIVLAPGASPDVARAGLPAVLRPGASETVGYGDAARLEATTGGTVQTTGSGKVVGLPEGYTSAFPAVVRPLVGRTRGVLLAQQTAANLHAGPGDQVVIGRLGKPDARVTVDGVVDLPAADSFFQAVGAGPGARAQAPPDNVVIVPFDRWIQLYDPAAGSGALQVHQDLAPGLPSDPSAAFTSLTALRHGYEAGLAGQVAVGDNLAASLGAARTDAAYGNLLFLFLGLPGVAVAAALTWLVTGTGRDRRRREQALLRARGASLAHLVRLALAESALVGVVGTAFGLLLSAVVARALWGVWLERTWWAASAAAAAGLGSVAGSILLPSLADARRLGVSEARIRAWAGRVQLRAAVVALCATGAGIATFVTTRRGYEVVLAPEGVPTVKVSYLSLLGPALAWLGGAAILPAFAATAILHGRGFVRRVARLCSVRISSLLAGWLVRLRASIAAAVLLMGLAVAFAVSTGIFNATFAAQSRVDAELTNGADVSVWAPPGVDLSGARRAIAGVRGVAAVEPMQHRFAYVGNDLQDLYGVRPDSIAEVTTLSDSYFGGGTAEQSLRALLRTPDGVFVSDETVQDFRLHRGDSIRIRLLDRGTHAYVPVPFRVLGIVREFPTAPTDSLLVANASYVAAETRSPDAETLLVRTRGRPPSAVGADVRGVLPPGTGAQVRDIEQQQRITGSGLVQLDLAGLSVLELTFGAVATFGAVGLLVALASAERRRSLVVLRALGARSREVAAVVAAEAMSLVALGAVGGTALGGTIGWLLVKELRGVFDPPPAHPLVPGRYLAVLACMLIAGGCSSIAATLAGTSRLGPEALRDLTL